MVTKENMMKKLLIWFSEKIQRKLSKKMNIRENKLLFPQSALQHKIKRLMIFLGNGKLSPQ